MSYPGSYIPTGAATYQWTTCALRKNHPKRLRKFAQRKSQRKSRRAA